MAATALAFESMAMTFLLQALPVPVALSPGSRVGLTALLHQAFGSEYKQYPSFYVLENSASQLTSWDFSYWNPDHPELAEFRIGSATVAPAQWGWIALAGTSTASFRAGNAIGPLAYINVQAGPNVTIEYAITTVDPSLVSPTAGKRAPTAAEIVRTAEAFAKHYPAVLNDNDCHFIAGAVAAAAGATFPTQTQSAHPSENQQGGFWRIAYRGDKTAHPVAGWYTLVKPGDIVRMANGDWHHTATILGVNPDGSMRVYDNGDTVDGHDSIGIHDALYDLRTDPAAITIYRLAADHLYLINGSSGGETLVGTNFNDDIVGAGGRDSLFGGVGNDVLDGGRGADHLSGGSGRDTATYVDASSGVTADLGDPAANTGDAAGDTYASIENLTGSRHADILAGTAGRNILTGGGGRDTFVFHGAGFGRDTITDFMVGTAAGHDVLDISHRLFAGLGALRSHASQVGADTVIRYDSGDTITLDHVHKGALVAANVHFF